MARPRVKYLPGDVRYKAGGSTKVRPERVEGPPRTTAPKPWYGEVVYVVRDERTGEIHRIADGDEQDGPFVWSREEDARSFCHGKHLSTVIECVVVPRSIAEDQGGARLATAATPPEPTGSAPHPTLGTPTP